MSRRAKTWDGETVTQLELPWPPSINHYWRHGKGRTYISAEGLTYRHNVEQLCLVERVPKFGTARIAVSIAAYPPDKRKRDIDNLLKVPLDALGYHPKAKGSQGARVYDDDSQIDDLRIVRRETAKPGKILVTIGAVQ